MREDQADLMLNALSNIAGSLERLAEQFCPEKTASELETIPPVNASARPPKISKKAQTTAAPAPATISPIKAPTDAAPAAVASAAYSEVDVRGFLRQVLDKKGWEFAETLLGKYTKTKKVKDLETKDYPAVIADCQKALK